MALGIYALEFRIQGPWGVLHEVDDKGSYNNERAFPPQVLELVPKYSHTVLVVRAG